MIYETVEQIFAGLDETRAKLVASVSDLTEQETSFRHAPEKWSAANIVEHLAKTEANLVRVVTKLLTQAETENVAATGRIEPPVSFVEIAEKASGQRFEAPEMIRPGGTATIAESLSELERSRAALRALRPRLEAVDLSNHSFPHPAFGKMNLYYWLAFIGLHEGRHLRQIQELLAGYKSAEPSA